MITPAKIKLLREQLRASIKPPVDRVIPEQVNANTAMSGSQKEQGNG